LGLTKKVFSSVKRPHPKPLLRGEKGLKVLSFGEDLSEAILFGQPQIKKLKTLGVLSICKNNSIVQAAA